MTQQINLYEERLRPRRELATARNVGIAALVLVLLIALLAAYVRQEADQKSAELAALQTNVSSEQERMTVLSKEIAGRRVSPALLAEQARIRSLLSSQEEVMAVLDSGQLGNTSGFSEFMLGFARQAQSDLWLSGFAVSAGGEEIEIRGRLLDATKLPGYVQRLSAEPIFHGRRFAMLEMRGVEPEAVPVAPAAATATVSPITAAGAAAPPLPPPLPRYVEFLLRSARGASTTASASAPAPAPTETESLMGKTERIIGAAPGSLGGDKP